MRLGLSLESTLLGIRKEVAYPTEGAYSTEQLQRPL